MLEGKRLSQSAGNGNIVHLRPQVYRIEAAVNDMEQLDTLLSHYPQPSGMRKKVRKPLFSWHWDAERHHDVWLRSDGENVELLKIVGLDEDQARDVRIVVRSYSDVFGIHVAFSEVPRIIDGVLRGEHLQPHAAVLA